MTTKFVHLRYGNLLDGRLEAKGGVTIGFDLNDSSKACYTIARCARTDHYNKAIGRAITSGRLQQGKGVRQVTLEEGKPVVEQIIKHALGAKA